MPPVADFMRCLQRHHGVELPQPRAPIGLPKIADGEFPAILPDGSSRALRIVAHAVADAAGNVLEFVVTCIDVTEQRRATTELQQACHETKRSEAQLRAIIDTIPTQLWYSFPDGTNEFSNQTWQDYTGLSSNEGSGLGWLRVMHSEELNEISKDWGSVMDFGGRYDRVAVPWMMVKYREYCPQATFVLFEKSGHNPQVEEPEKEFLIINDFLAK